MVFEKKSEIDKLINYISHLENKLIGINTSIDKGINITYDENYEKNKIKDTITKMKVIR
jgi:hypothetical protein